MIGSDEEIDQGQAISARIEKYEYGRLHPQVFLFISYWCNNSANLPIQSVWARKI
jgi:hypothetical protein